MKNILLLSLILCVSVITGCSKSDYLRVSNNSDDFIQLDKIDVRSMVEVEDAKKNKAILVELAETGQLKMQLFTRKNIGKNVFMSYANVIVLKNTYIAEESSMKKFYLSVSDKELIKRIIESYPKH